MIYKLNYQPFSYFWQNCQLNNAFSVLVSVEPSYRFAAFLNDYHYFTNKASIGENSYSGFLDLSYKYGIKKYIEDVLIYKNVNLSKQENEWSSVLKIEEYYFKQDDSFLEEINEFLKNKKAISVGVNLFYWVKGSISYEQYQYNHYALITGYDNEKLEYCTFDDDLFGYKMHYIPEERFRIAYSNSDFKEPPAFIIDACEGVQPYKLSINNVLEHAHRLKENISDIDMNNIWDISAPDEEYSEAVDKCVINAHRVANRHIGNKLLFESLHNLGLVSNEGIIHKYMKIEDELIEGWIEIKNVIAMCKFADKNNFSIKKINGLDKKLLEREHSMWDEITREL